jgi:hypothetical protein
VVRMFLIALIAISKVPKSLSWLVYTQICKHKMQVIQCILILSSQGLADIFYTETVTGAAVQRSKFELQIHLILEEMHCACHWADGSCITKLLCELRYNSCHQGLIDARHILNPIWSGFVSV